MCTLERPSCGEYTTDKSVAKVRERTSLVSTLEARPVSS